ncbi:hypothetical protein DPX16_12313 [Anabarilius grahami]|uniref:Uncharacterized protein n=1 Tax=Anabarilius grahami TaxID=495550 RepID=A0A3N0XGJ8_ANAGA|nr:hypothetical protein DPX16_12313 [Anabarilius grahami]
MKNAVKSRRGQEIVGSASLLCDSAKIFYRQQPTIRLHHCRGYMGVQDVVWKSDALPVLYRAMDNPPTRGLCVCKAKLEIYDSPQLWPYLTATSCFQLLILCDEVNQRVMSAPQDSLMDFLKRVVDVAPNLCVSSTQAKKAFLEEEATDGALANCQKQTLLYNTLLCSKTNCRQINIHKSEGDVWLQVSSI